VSWWDTLKQAVNCLPLTPFWVEFGVKVVHLTGSSPISVEWVRSYWVPDPKREIDPDSKFK
jgi:hypothetical protein